jgi:DNA-binding transcriptional MerR regulator
MHEDRILVRISDLARVAGVPVATIKFYLREGLLPAGRLSSKTQAQYDESHLQRLRVVRFLTDYELSVSAAKDLLARIDNPPESATELLEIAHAALASRGEEHVDIRFVLSMLRRWGWQVDAESCDSVRSFAHDLSALHSIGILLSQEELDGFAQAMRDAAEIESDRMPIGPISAQQIDWVVR